MATLNAIVKLMAENGMYPVYIRITKMPLQVDLKWDIF